MSTINRRGFLGVSATALAAFGLKALNSKTLPFSPTSAFAADDPLPAGATEVPEKDVVAGALGYHPDATKVDVKKWKKKAAKDGKTQSCANCAFYTASNKSFGKCTMIASGLVRSKGWCNSWQKKA